MEFQVFYDQVQPGVRSTEPTAPAAVGSVLIRAEKEKEALQIASRLKLTILAIGPGRILLYPHQQWFDRSEAGEYLRGTACKIDELMADGSLRKASKGRPLFSRAELDAVANRRMGSGEAEKRGDRVPDRSGAERHDYDFARGDFSGSVARDVREDIHVL